MSDFVDLLVGMLPLRSPLQDEDNSLRVVLDRTVGCFMDESLGYPFEELFLDSAGGSWLDVWGRDFGVPRRLGEGDDSYRERIVFEKLEFLTVDNLCGVFGLVLYGFVEGFDAGENLLTSDNPYVSDRYMAFADEDLRRILDKKFVLGGGLVWL